MTVDTFLIAVREIVGDQKKTKYTDSTLVNLYNDGMADIVKKTSIFRKETSILVENGIVKYQLPNDVYFITRVTQNNDVIPLRTFTEMDIAIPGWEAREGTDIIDYVVYDKQDLGNITIYPILNGIGGTYFKLPDGTSVVLETGTEGAVTYLEHTETDYTVVINEDDANYGALVSIDYDWFPVKIQYVRKPKEVVLADIASTDVELDIMHYTTLKYYMAGILLFNDDKIENVQKGSVLLEKYRADIEDMSRISAKNFTRVNRLTSYASGFN